ncbi:alpha/beta fold hydrolase [Deinococcus deserti]|uniref:Putative carboxylesterase n=1 Tax=Deinococcus deserti (strain DSM 17065 / CIP 109153 / LMG 22923 / VCD115) TaxID=546414 RepID=C1CWZ0_DEIDV|nr:alpha/beta fold hydrolase [Deinococcus deserti]ACO46707.1 putative carboxylesterase [Deinococcus deserti VCD115]
MTAEPGGHELTTIVQPPRAPQPGKAPALVLLHGVGANETSLLGLTPRLDPRLTIISVRAPLELHPGGYGFFRVQFTPEPVIVPHEAEASRQMLIEFLPRLVRQHGIDPEKVFVLGFSQGAIIGASVALSRPDLVAGLVMLSGRILPEARPHFQPRDGLDHLPVFVGHGVADSKLGIHHGRASQALLAELGVQLTCREYDMGHEISPQELDDVNAWLSDRL